MAAQMLTVGEHTLPDAGILSLLGISRAVAPTTTESYEVLEQLPMNLGDNNKRYLVRQRAPPCTEYIVELFTRTDYDYSDCGSDSPRRTSTDVVKIEAWPGRDEFEIGVAAKQREADEKLQRLKDTQAERKRKAQEEMRSKFETFAEQPEFVNAMVRFHEPYSLRHATYLSFYVLESDEPLQLGVRAARLALDLDSNGLIPPEWQSCLDSEKEVEKWHSYQSRGLLDSLQNYLGPKPELEEAYQVDGPLHWANTDQWWITYEMTFFIASPGRATRGEGSIEKKAAPAVDGMNSATVTVRTLDGSEELVMVQSLGQPVVGDIRAEYARMRGLPLLQVALLRGGDAEVLRDTEVVADGYSLTAVIRKKRLLILEATRIEDHS